MLSDDWHKGNQSQTKTEQEREHQTLISSEPRHNSQATLDIAVVLWICLSINNYAYFQQFAIHLNINISCIYRDIYEFSCTMNN